MSFIGHLKDKVLHKTPTGWERSSRWPIIRKEHLADNPFCVVCGGNKKVEVHHIKPFHLYPSLELDRDNLMTLCERKKYGLNCHLLIGHVGNYRRMNIDCVSDAIQWHKKLNGKP